MTTLPNTPGERLRHARLLLKKTGGEVGDLLGISKAGVSAWETDKVAISTAIGLAMEHVLGISCQWLLTGTGPTWSIKNSDPSIESGFVQRPLLPGSASCGQGGEISDPGPKAVRYPFRKDFVLELLQESGAGSIEDLFVVECTGESMRPTIHPGDLALINTVLDLRIQPKRNSLYLVRPDPASSDARIKRVRVGNGQLWFLSDAQGFAPVSVDLDSLPLQSLILGRVCWISRTVVREERLERNW